MLTYAASRSQAQTTPTGPANDVSRRSPVRAAGMRPPDLGRAPEALFDSRTIPAFAFDRVHVFPAAAPADSRLAVQRQCDPSPPPDLEIDPAAKPAAGGDPVFDDGSAADATGGPATKKPAAPVQAASDGARNGARGQAEAARVSSSLGGGAALDSGTRDRMGTFFGADFSDVHVHTGAGANALARALHAQAFTVGSEIAFANGRYVPGRPDGQRLLAHELTHVIQQRRGLDADIRRAGIGAAGDVYEAQAERNADRFARGDMSEVRGGGAPSPSGAGGALQLYSGSAAAAYAKKWALVTNPAYPRDGNDCTNFVSQAVLAGGWTMAGGSCDDRKDDTAWWYGDWTCWKPGVHRSYTWGGAQNFYNFTAGGRGKLASSVKELNVGDVLQVGHGGHIGHTTMVTDKQDGNLFLSYHTNDTLNLPFWGAGGFHERTAGESTVYFSWKL